MMGPLPKPFPPLTLSFAPTRLSYIWDVSCDSLLGSVSLFTPDRAIEGPPSVPARNYDEALDAVRTYRLSRPHLSSPDHIDIPTFSIPEADLPDKPVMEEIPEPPEIRVEFLRGSVDVDFDIPVISMPSIAIKSISFDVAEPVFAEVREPQKLVASFDLIDRIEYQIPQLDPKSLTEVAKAQLDNPYSRGFLFTFTDSRNTARLAAILDMIDEEYRRLKGKLDLDTIQEVKTQLLAFIRGKIRGELVRLRLHDTANKMNLQMITAYNDTLTRRYRAQVAVYEEIAQGYYQFASRAASLMNEVAQLELFSSQVITALYKLRSRYAGEVVSLMNQVNGLNKELYRLYRYATSLQSQALQFCVLRAERLALEKRWASSMMQYESAKMRYETLDAVAERLQYEQTYLHEHHRLLYDEANLEVDLYEARKEAILTLQEALLTELDALRAQADTLDDLTKAQMDETHASVMRTYASIIRQAVYDYSNTVRQVVRYLGDCLYYGADLEATKMELEARVDSSLENLKGSLLQSAKSSHGYASGAVAAQDILQEAYITTTLIETVSG